MPNEPKYVTAYEMYVNTNVHNVLCDGGGVYNYKELAEKVGLKPTQHFKRRINQMVARGRISCVASFTLRGGIENRFTALPSICLEGVPF